MTNLSKKTAVIFDHGLFFSLALRLSREFGRVMYGTPWQRGFASYHEYDIGVGFDDVEHYEDFWDVVEGADENYVFIFPDVMHGDMQIYLRAQGHRVFGSGKGDELELYRRFQKELMKTVGLPVQDYTTVIGIDALRKELKRRGTSHVKISLLRGITETFKYINDWQSASRLNQLEHNLGPRGKDTEFLIEDPIETNIEYGFDGICIDGQFPKLAANGVEKKDVAYAAVVQNYDDLPTGMRLVNKKLSRALAHYKYRNFFSTEIRVAKDNTPYLIDLTCRMPSPAGESEHELWSNLGEMIWSGSEGVLVEPKPSAKYAVQSIIKSDRSKDEWQAVSFPDEIRNNVKLYFETRIDGHSYVVPQLGAAKMSEIGSVVTTGNTLQEAIDKNIELAEQVEGDTICICTDDIQSIVKEFEEMESKGMSLKPASI